MKIAGKNSLVSFMVCLLSLFALPVLAETQSPKGARPEKAERDEERVSEGVATTHEFNFRVISTPGGLSYDGVKDIVRDSDGFVWVLLDEDLLRFDGYEYKRYYSHFKGVGAELRLQFHNISSDTRGRLHVACVQGLFRYDRLTDSFERILDRADRVFFDGQDNLWVEQGYNLGIMRGVDSLDFKLYNGKMLNDIVSVESCAGGSSILSASYGRILSYDHSRGEFSPFYTLPADRHILKAHIAGDKLWMLISNHGLAVIDIPSRRLEAVYDFPLRYEGLTVLMRDLLVDKYGRLWIATQQGIWFFDPRTGERWLYRHSDTDIFSIPHNSVWSVSDDHMGNILIGTFNGGLCVVNLDESKSITTYIPHRSGLNNNMVSAFAEDDDALWVGTEGGGVNRLDKDTGEFTCIVPKIPGAGSSPPGNHIKSLVRDDAGRLWIATFLGGLVNYDVSSGAFRYFSSKSPESVRLLYNNMRKIVPEGDRGLWIAYQHSKHVVSFLPYAGGQGGGIEHYYFDSGGKEWYIMDICRNGDYLWIVTQRKLYRMDVRDRSVVDVSSDKIPFLNGRSLCVDTGGNVLVGTTGSGFFRYDIDTGGLSNVPGFADHGVSTVFSTCLDDDGALWIGTDNGLFRHTPDTGEYLRLDEADGTQGQIYNPLASMLTASGKLLFGGTNGFSIVDPQSVNRNTHIPKTLISGFTIDNAPALPRLGDEASGTLYEREVVIAHRETSFGFRLASDNYATPSKTRFRYRLEEYDPAPVTVGADSRTVVYSNVPPGTYEFEAAASTDGEVWGTPVSVKIVRKPAPWNSTAAWLLYSAVMLAIAGTIIHYYMERRRLAKQLYLDSLDKQKKEELHQSQLRFFTNISHDFRTPLSLILGAVDNLGNRGSDDKYYRIVESNSRRLLGLVNELMDFRTVENEMRKLQVHPSEINRLVRSISADFVNLARERSIDFRVECDEVLSVLVPVDRSVVEKIVMNLLNNAFKYTPRGGKITLSTLAPGRIFRSGYFSSHRISTDREADKRFTIVVGDTGVGISKESIGDVFERFYKVDTANADSHLGTGIGLALVKSLVLLHHGAITIFSERERGTDMVVELPFDGSIYRSDEISRESAEPDDGRYIETDSGEKVPDGQSVAESMLMRTRKRILIVEDNDDLRMLIADFLSAEYEVVQAADGSIASEWLGEDDADLIISDVMMPGKDGITLCREVKENIATSHIPFVLLTAKTGIEYKLEGAGSGADLYFEKPVDLNLLLMSIGNIFNNRSTLREYYSKNYFVESSELSQNEHDNAFLRKLMDTIDRNLTEPTINVEFIASEFLMSRRTLYTKAKALTGKSIGELILNYRMRKAARLIVEQDMTMLQIMECVGVKSPSYFAAAFKKEFGKTPAEFAKSNGKRRLAKTRQSS